MLPLASASASASPSPSASASAADADAAVNVVCCYFWQYYLKNKKKKLLIKLPRWRGDSSKKSVRISRTKKKERKKISELVKPNFNECCQNTKKKKEKWSRKNKKKETFQTEVIYF